MAQRRLIMVLGMGRSGTSAIAKVLELCGGRLPAALMPPNFANPKGYWEPELAVSINDGFLLRHGSSWYDPTLRLQAGDASIAADATADFVNAIAAFLRASDGSAPLVIKEPRITGLLPYWLEAARREGYAAAFVIALRAPGEVAQSLLVRDRISGDYSDVLWLKYSLLAERGTRCGPRAVVSFASLLSSWETEIAHVARALDVDLKPGARGDEVASFLSAELYHHRQGDDDLERTTLPLTGRIFEQMSVAAKDGSLDTTELDAAFDRYLACDRLVRAEGPGWSPPPRAAQSVPAEGAQPTEAEIDRASIPMWDIIGWRIAAAIRAHA